MVTRPVIICFDPVGILSEILEQHFLPVINGIPLWQQTVKIIYQGFFFLFGLSQDKHIRLPAWICSGAKSLAQVHIVIISLCRRSNLPSLRLR